MEPLSQQEKFHLTLFGQFVLLHPDRGLTVEQLVDQFETEVLSVDKTPISMQLYIEQRLLAVFGLESLSDIMIRTRRRETVIPRQTYFAAMRRFATYGQNYLSGVIFDQFGIRWDHTTIHHAEHCIENIYLPGKVVTEADRYYATLVQKFWGLVKMEYNRQKQLNNEHYPASGAGK
jgi:hypothetical protein